MKRNYVKPELEVVMFALESQILANSPGGEGAGVKPGVGGDEPNATNKFEGSWNSNNWE